MNCLARPFLFVLVVLSFFPVRSLDASERPISGTVADATAQADIEKIILPAGDLFKPLLADLKEPRFYLSYRRYDYEADRINVATGGYGDIIGLYRKKNNRDGSSWQVSFGGGIHSQFNLDAHSFALVNTDFTIGFPFTYRKGRDSYRVALYHQSSHLGDEFLLETKADRLELSYEAINFIFSREWEAWRVYAGGEYLVHKVPNLRPLGAQAGIEYYGTQGFIGSRRLVGGLDVKIDQEHDWALNTSFKAGLQYDSSEKNGGYIRLLFEGYKGYAPHGQFYTTRLGFYGVGVALGFD